MRAPQQRQAHDSKVIPGLEAGKDSPKPPADTIGCGLHGCFAGIAIGIVVGVIFSIVKVYFIDKHSDLFGEGAPTSLALPYGEGSYSA